MTDLIKEMIDSRQKHKKLAHSASASTGNEAQQVVENVADKVTPSHGRLS
jgi:hypothetical protein